MDKMNNIATLIIWGATIACVVSHPLSYSVEFPGTNITKVKELSYKQVISNPCRYTFTTPHLDHEISHFASDKMRSFYKNLLAAINSASNQIETIRKSDIILPSCEGIHLTSLPPLPDMDKLSSIDFLAQMYRTGSNLAVHLNIMIEDRYINREVKTTKPVKEKMKESERFMSKLKKMKNSWKSKEAWENKIEERKFNSCGNETSRLNKLYNSVKEEVEVILCHVVEHDSLFGRSLFRESYDELMETEIFRYHEICTLILTRDCIVLREAKMILEDMKKAVYMRLQNVADETENLI